MSKYTYVEVVAKADKSVVHRVNVTGQSERNIDRVEDGMNINLDHELFFTKVAEYEVEQAKP